MATFVEKIGARWEVVYPVLSGIVGAVIGWRYAPGWLHSMHTNQWVIENIFVAIFTLGTVAAGFGLAIYTFLLTTESGFIGRAKRSIYYRHLLTHVLVATVLSAILALVSVPGMVIKDAPHPQTLHALYVAIWSGMIAWTGAALVRAGNLFAIFAREHH
jgi:hypothetical protein